MLDFAKPYQECPNAFGQDCRCYVCSVARHGSYAWQLNEASSICLRLCNVDLMREETIVKLHQSCVCTMLVYVSADKDHVLQRPGYTNCKCAAQSSQVRSIFSMNGHYNHCLRSRDRAKVAIGTLGQVPWVRNVRYSLR